MAIQTGLQAAYKAFSDPESVQNSITTTRRAETYSQAWSYYRKKMFSRRDSFDWSAYLASRELYKHTRLIYNPVPSIVDFYVDNVWQAAENNLYRALSTPVADGADESLVEAIAQIDQWTNWRGEQQKVKRYAAATGNVLIEVIDDGLRDKITQKTVWAGYVTDLQLSDADDVLAYTLEWSAYDSDKKETYVYKKIITKESFSYFRDDKPFIPNGKSDAVEENPYQFCPAAWIKHIDDGAFYGLPACEDFDKVDEVNSLASHLHDNIHKEIESGKLLGIDDPATIRVLTGGAQNSDGTINENDPRLERVLLAAKGNVSVHDLSGLLKLAEAHPYLKELIASFADDYPELQAHAIIKQNTQLSGAALERLLTPAQNRLDRAAANYDQQLIKLRQMQIAIAGWRTRNGWQNLTDQQRKFAAFNLESYQDGNLDFNLKRSLLIETTDEEREDLAMKRTNRAVGSDGILPLTEKLKILGKSEAEIKAIKAELKTETASVGAALGKAFDAGNNLPAM